MANRVKSGLNRHSSRNKAARRKRATLVKTAHGTGVVILAGGHELLEFKTGRLHGFSAISKSRPETIRYAKAIPEMPRLNLAAVQLVTKLQETQLNLAAGQLVTKLGETQNETSKAIKKENTKLDLSNITIVTTAQPSRESEIIHQYFTLRKYREFKKKKEDFLAEYERTLIEKYEQLDEKEKDNAYELLEKEYQSL